jgi:hypothetical protein
VLFAPVYFSRGFHFRAGFTFSPSIVISIGMLQVNLFTCPRYSHYYFGDYYDNVYLGIGIFPQFRSERIHLWYDPIYVYDRWNNRRTEPRWEEHEQHEYDLRRNDKNLRPPRTYREMETRQAGMSEEQRKSFRVAHPMTEASANRATMKFQQINTKTQRQITTKATEVSKFSDKRNQWESAPTTEKTTQPSKGHKGLFTKPSEHKETVVQPVEHKGSVTQPTEHKESISLPAEHKGPVTIPSEHKQISAPQEHKVSVTQPTDNTPAFVPPRNVRVTQSEKVKIPNSPIVGKSASSDKSNAGPPSRPVEERKQVDDSRNKDNGRDNNKGGDKDTGGNKDSGRNNRDKGK